jgi:putative nucleotidyltransferase with HDIG domain
VDLTVRVAETLGLNAEDVARVRTAALLHDIGKLGVPDEILHKPGKLDEREWEVMRQHPVIGERILRAIPGLGVVARIVRHEHERWDGDGYPDGLAEAEIPVGARIILACDAYHAMVSDRPYRKAMSHSDAVGELTRNAGSQFDPDVVEALIGVLYGRRQAGFTSV